MDIFDGKGLESSGGAALTAFVPGRELNRRYYRRVIAPILRSQFRDLRYSAALMGPGSEVLGFDTELSTDHDWGPRAQIFLTPTDAARRRSRILETLERDLPRSFAGFRTRFGPPDSDGVRTRVSDETEEGTALVWIGTMGEFFRGYLDLDATRKLTTSDWLLLPSQKLRSIAAGPIYRDDLGLARARAKLRYYPNDVWRYLLAVQWLRVAENEAFVGRAGDVGDELGARLLAARQVRELMRLAFLLERTYYPYSKWFGRAFSELFVASSLRPQLARVLSASTPRAREAALSRAYELLAGRQNALRISAPLPTRVSHFHSRPYLVIHAGSFAEAIRSRIRDRRLRVLPRIGSIDQFGDTGELGSKKNQLAKLRSLLNA